MSEAKSSTHTRKRRGGRRATGTAVRARDGRWQPMVTLADGTRKRVPGVRCRTKAEAKRKAEHFAEVAQRHGVKRKSEPSQPAGTLPDDGWWDLYFAEREARGLGNVRNERAQYLKHIAPQFSRPMDALTEADCELLRDYLDDCIAAHNEQPAQGMRWTTARNIWAIFTTACRVAAGKKTSGKFKPKNKALRVRNDNPCRDVAAPDRGGLRATAWLLPSEGCALLACRGVPVERRRRYALAIYSYLRPGELAALEHDDIDLDARRILVHRGWDYHRGEAKETKSARARRVPIEHTLLPMLASMALEQRGSGPVIDMPDRKLLSRWLRSDLQLAGVTRAELFAERSDKTRRRIVFRDLRATGVTWRALRGDSEIAVQRQAGHRDLATTAAHYVREVDASPSEVALVFAPLPQELCEPPSAPIEDAKLARARRKRTRQSHAVRQHSGIAVGPQGLETCNDAKSATVGAGHGGGETSTGANRPQPLRTAETRAFCVCDSSGTDAPTFDAVEVALEQALRAATAAGNWRLVAELARELGARREARRRHDAEP